MRRLTGGELRETHPDADRSWMKRNGVEYDEEAIALEMERGDDAVGVQVTARKAMVGSLDDPVQIGNVSKKACLSVKNVPKVAKILAKYDLEDELETALAAAITHEMALGKASKWHGYLESLPEEGEPVPLLWPEPFLEALNGTDLLDKVMEDREVCKAAWEGAVYPLLRDALGAKGSSGLGGKQGLATYMKAVSFATSRAFYVDSEHLEALVPLADMFNHKVLSLRPPGKGIAI